MNPIRRRRLFWILALVAGAGLAVSLVAMALQRNVAYLYTPSEIHSGEAGERVSSGEARFRLGGMVAANSLRREPGSMQAQFTVSDGDGLMPVVYTGILPDLFRENQAVVATGRMKDGRFVAEEVLAKHDEAYMPKEVADKMGKAHRRHDVAAGTAPAAGAPGANAEAAAPYGAPVAKDAYAQPAYGDRPAAAPVAAPR